MKKTLLASALLLATGVANAAAITSGEFVMLDPTNAYVGGASDITGDVDVTGGTWGVSSATPFFGLLWTAHTGTILGEGAHSIDTIQGGMLDFTVGAGQVGAHILFNWGATVDIDVVNVWDVSTVAGVTTYTSTDVDGDGILGLGMVDGAFPGFNANFNLNTAATSAVPVPAAVWLFGSGLLGLVGVARRKAA